MVGSSHYYGLLRVIWSFLGVGEGSGQTKGKSTALPKQELCLAYGLSHMAGQAPVFPSPCPQPCPPSAGLADERDH